MPLHLELTNFDDIFHSTRSDKVLINEIDIFSTENKTWIDNLILKNYSEDNLSIIPSCQCGELKGTYYVGDVCPSCKTTVTSSVEDSLSFLLWVKAPLEVEYFVSPILLAILRNRYKITKPNVPLIDYIMTPAYTIDRKHQKKNMFMLERLDYLLQANGIKKTYNDFVKHFFKIIEILDAEFVKEKAADKQEFQDFLLENKSKLFSQYLPFPNKVMFAMDSNELGKFIDKSILNPINVIRRLTGIDLHTKPSYVKQRKVAKSLIDLSEFYVGYMKTTFFSKPGLLRQHISSTRSHFTARAVISSLIGPHEYDEIHLPWSLSCTLFREHILNCLYRRNFTYKQAVNFLVYCNKIYSPLLDEIFKEIIRDAGGCVKAFFNRNPSLHRGSIQTVRITQIKSNVDDNTISFSLLIMPSFNSDLDGDSMNLTLALTKSVHDSMVNFEPHHNVLGLNAPNEFSNNIKLPKTVVSTISNWFNN